MIISDDAIQFIRLQRTDHKNIDTIKNDYVKDIEWDFESIKSHIPTKAENILDIGCGVGAINVLFYNHYKKSTLYLLDKTELPKQIYYGMADRTPYYNSLHVTAKTMIDNGVLASDIIYMEAEMNFGINVVDKKFDLITSFISWGFHYPVETYLPEVIRTIKPDGVLIIDLRNTKDIDILAKYFQQIDIITTKNKATRVCARIE